MNIIFFGSSQFAVPALKALVEAGENISCVVTQPDRKKGRHMLKAVTPVKEAALGLGLEVFQADDVNSPSSLKFLRGLDAEIFVVISFGQILSQAALDIPGLPINIHASLLPKLRGAAPINRAIINSEKKTGVTIMKMVRRMDAGPIIAQMSIPILESDDAVTLEDKLSGEGAGLLLKILSEIKKNNYKLTPQKESEVTLAPKLKKNDGLIEWSKPAVVIHNLIRGCLDWPVAFTYYKGKLLKIYKAEVVSQSPNASLKPGQIVEVLKDRITVACGKDNLLIRELQIEGKRRMSAGEFVAGHKINAGEIFSKK